MVRPPSASPLMQALFWLSLRRPSANLLGGTVRLQNNVFPASESFSHTRKHS